jgi:peptidoglycan/LPS O-acetylase OafA/YrhL
MRWAAAFIVFFFHARTFGYFNGDSARVVDLAFGAGATGVSFFFILSGFVLAWSWRPEDNARTFWRRRIARIYPVHLVTACLALCLALTLVPGLWPSGLPEAAANLLLVSSWHADWWQALNPVSWSLTCEAFFYTAFPLLYTRLRSLGPRGLTHLAAACAGSVMLLPGINLYFDMGWTLHSFPLARLPEFILGATIGRMVQIGAWRGPGSEAAMALTLLGYVVPQSLFSSTNYAAYTVIGFACLIPAAALNDLDRARSMWRRRWLVRLGEWSFSFYMIHVLVMRAVEQAIGASPRLPATSALALTAAVFVISLSLSWALYRWVEQPGRRWILRTRRLPTAGRK